MYDQLDHIRHDCDERLQCFCKLVPLGTLCRIVWRAGDGFTTMEVILSQRWVSGALINAVGGHSIFLIFSVLWFVAKLEELPPPHSSLRQLLPLCASVPQSSRSSSRKPPQWSQTHWEMLRGYQRVIGAQKHTESTIVSNYWGGQLLQFCYKPEYRGVNNRPPSFKTSPKIGDFWK